MNQSARIFRNVLSQICQSRRAAFREILDTFDVEDTLEHADGNNLRDQELVGTVLWQCCCTDGKFNNAAIVFLAVMQFCKERLGDMGTQPFIDLGQMLKAGTTEEAITKWVETHYADS